MYKKTIKPEPNVNPDVIKAKTAINLVLILF